MPELPEVEVVRRGLQEWACDLRVADVEMLDHRSFRRHTLGPSDFAARVTDAVFLGAERRGKYLWLPLGDANEESTSLVVHLGMSGQMLVSERGIPDQRHLRCRMQLDGGRELRFVDQRIFGGLFLDRLVDAGDGSDEQVPAAVSHIGRDPLDPLFSIETVFGHTRRRRTEIKRILLDQSIAAGIGNIYADEALWQAGVHYATPANSLTLEDVDRLYMRAREVMESALRQGGTSFDSLYVNVNGESGYFSRSLEVYGREGRACRRCGELIVRAAFMNRSSHFCPRCQPLT